MNGALDLAEVDPIRRADVANDHIIATRRKWHREHRRPPALTAREALAALQFEAMLVWVAGCNLANGIDLSDEDRARLSLACSRITSVCEEVMS